MYGAPFERGNEGMSQMVDRYAVEKWAEETFPEAITEGRTERSISIDLRIRWMEKPGGERWAEVSYVDRKSGKLMPVNEDGATGLPLADPTGLDWMLKDVIAALGWAEFDRRHARRDRTRARRAARAGSLRRRSGFAGRGSGLLMLDGGAPPAEEIERFVRFGAGLRWLDRLPQTC